MIVDTSALVAIVFNEPGWERFEDALLQAETARMGAPNWFELCMVLDNRSRPSPQADTAELLLIFRIEVVSFDADLAKVARLAHQRFGRGNHPAQLNYGDCMAYALARATGKPLLFKGDDVPKTDITPALH